MNFFKNNLRLLEKSDPLLAKKVSKINDSKTFRTVKTNCGLPTLLYRNNGKDIFVHSKYNPLKEGESLINRNKFKNPKIVIFLGLGLGYHFNSFLAKRPSGNKFILIIEKELQIFRKFLESFNLTSILSQGWIRFLVGIENERLYSILLDYFNGPQNQKILVKAMEFFELPSLVSLHKDYYISALGSIKDAVRDTLNLYGNAPDDSLIGIENILLNIITIAKSPGINQLFGKFKNKPAVIVATGPSLNKNIHLLPEIKGRALFFSADASLKTLLLRGIVPDMVSSLERNLTTKNHFEQIPGHLKHHLKDIYLTACPVVRPEVYAAYSGPNIIVYRNFAHFKWLPLNKGILDTGKSVTNMAFKIAEALGCNPIILVGQDLAFAEDGSTHAENADHAREGMAKSALRREIMEVMGNNGKMIRTLATWYGMLKRFEYDINGFNGLCINATEGGAKINGAVVLTLREVIDKYLLEEFDPMKIIAENLIYPDEKELAEDLNKNYDLLKTTDKFLFSVIERCEEGIRTLEDFGKGVGREDGNIIIDELKEDYLKATLKELENLLTKIMTDDKMFYLFLMHIVQSFIIKNQIEYNALSSHFDNQKEIYLAGILKFKEIFVNLKSLTEISQGYLKRAIKEVGDKRNNFVDAI
ncbi:MAG: 6-hydroxymethylpterin diphosphokinase MptE-like protein [Thermodesulfobacteriota bacterium]|nr:6-hydroxymethylpterin diphosphokinase MptE-like protein [Thermodesulfobacteriota bacterium]